MVSVISMVNVSSILGLLLRMFMNLYDMEVIYEEAFTRWKEEVNDLQPGKGQALFQVEYFNFSEAVFC